MFPLYTVATVEIFKRAIGERDWKAKNIVTDFFKHTGTKLFSLFD